MRRRRNTRGRHIASATAIAVVIVLALAGYFIGTRLEEQAFPEERSEMSDNFGKLPTTEYQGVTYQMKPNLTTILLIGYDKNDDTPTVGFRQGGQSDFLLLLVIDNKAKTVRQLHIERDSITNVVTLGVTGNEVGTRLMQICLSHGFGATPEDNCGYTVQAVRNLLQGVPVDLYVAMDIRGIDIFNDALGGVTVTIEDDFSAYDPTMEMGSTMTLRGHQAEIFVRSRKEVGVGTNESRMRRQQMFMHSASELLRQRLKENISFADELLDRLDGVMNTNMTRGRLINEVNRAYTYDILPVETLTGEYKLGDDGFMEFHVDEKSIIAWVIQAFYNPLGS